MVAETGTYTLTHTLTLTLAPTHTHTLDTRSECRRQYHM